MPARVMILFLVLVIAPLAKAAQPAAAGPAPPSNIPYDLSVMLPSTVDSPSIDLNAPTRWSSRT